MEAVWPGAQTQFRAGGGSARPELRLGDDVFGAWRREVADALGPRSKWEARHGVAGDDWAAQPPADVGWASVAVDACCQLLRLVYGAPTYGRSAWQELSGRVADAARRALCADVLETALVRSEIMERAQVQAVVRAAADAPGGAKGAEFAACARARALVSMWRPARSVRGGDPLVQFMARALGAEAGAPARGLLGAIARRVGRYMALSAGAAAITGAAVAGLHAHAGLKNAEADQYAEDIGAASGKVAVFNDARQDGMGADIAGTEVVDPRLALAYKAAAVEAAQKQGVGTLITTDHFRARTDRLVLDAAWLIGNPTGAVPDASLANLGHVAGSVYYGHSQGGGTTMGILYILAGVSVTDAVVQIGDIPYNDDAMFATAANGASPAVYRTAYALDAFLRATGPGAQNTVARYTDNAQWISRALRDYRLDSWSRDLPVAMFVVRLGSGTAVERAIGAAINTESDVELPERVLGAVVGVGPDGGAAGGANTGAAGGANIGTMVIIDRGFALLSAGRLSVTVAVFILPAMGVTVPAAVAAYGLSGAMEVGGYAMSTGGRVGAAFVDDDNTQARAAWNTIAMVGDIASRAHMLDTLTGFAGTHFYSPEAMLEYAASGPYHLRSWVAADPTIAHKFSLWSGAVETGGAVAAGDLYAAAQAFKYSQQAAAGLQPVVDIFASLGGALRMRQAGQVAREGMDAFQVHVGAGRARLFSVAVARVHAEALLASYPDVALPVFANTSAAVFLLMPDKGARLMAAAHADKWLAGALHEAGGQPSAARVDTKGFLDAVAEGRRKYQTWFAEDMATLRGQAYELTEMLCRLGRIPGLGDGGQMPDRLTFDQASAINHQLSLGEFGGGVGVAPTTGVPPGGTPRISDDVAAVLTRNLSQRDNCNQARSDAHAGTPAEQLCRPGSTVLEDGKIMLGALWSSRRGAWSEGSPDEGGAMAYITDAPQRAAVLCVATVAPDLIPVEPPPAARLADTGGRPLYDFQHFVAASSAAPGNRETLEQQLARCIPSERVTGVDSALGKTLIAAYGDASKALAAVVVADEAMRRKRADAGDAAEARAQSRGIPSRATAVAGTPGVTPEVAVAAIAHLVPEAVVHAIRESGPFAGLVATANRTIGARTLKLAWATPPIAGPDETAVLLGTRRSRVQMHIRAAELSFAALGQIKECANPHENDLRTCMMLGIVDTPPDTARDDVRVKDLMAYTTTHAPVARAAHAAARAMRARAFEGRQAALGPTAEEEQSIRAWESLLGVGDGKLLYAARQSALAIGTAQCMVGNAVDAAADSARAATRDTSVAVSGPGAGCWETFKTAYRRQLAGTHMGPAAREELLAALEAAVGRDHTAAAVGMLGQLFAHETNSYHDALGQVAQQYGDATTARASYIVSTILAHAGTDGDDTLPFTHAARLEVFDTHRAFWEGLIANAHDEKGLAKDMLEAALAMPHGGFLPFLDGIVTSDADAAREARAGLDHYTEATAVVRRRYDVVSSWYRLRPLAGDVVIEDDSGAAEVAWREAFARIDDGDAAGFAIGGNADELARTAPTMLFTLREAEAKLAQEQTAQLVEADARYNITAEVLGAYAALAEPAQPAARVGFAEPATRVGLAERGAGGAVSFAELRAEAALGNQLFMFG